MQNSPIFYKVEATPKFMKIRVTTTMEKNNNINRLLRVPQDENILLLGPRRVGKSTLLKTQFSNTSATFIDLLKTDVYFSYQKNPSLLRELYSSGSDLIIIDEIQRIPELLYEVHWMIENTERNFIVSGSSARKLRREGVTNLAGRLSSRYLHPFVSAEIPNDDLLRKLQYGCLPPVVYSSEPSRVLKDYCGEYLKEEIQNEGVVRNVPQFARFLQVAATCNAEMVSYSTIGRECGISPKTVQAYFQILDDTLLGYFLYPWTDGKIRRSITATPKFYFFDCGVPHILLERDLSPKTPEFGKSFEQWLMLETRAAQSYGKHIRSLYYWRTTTGVEVDLLINKNIAVEFKTGHVSIDHTYGLVLLNEELPLKKKWIVCMEKEKRTLQNGVEVLPWQHYLDFLWNPSHFE